MTPYLTPRQVADLLQLAKPEQVRDLIHSGALPAVNVSSGTKRATWRIDPAALAAFIAARTTSPPAPPLPRRRKPLPMKVTKYF